MRAQLQQLAEIRRVAVAMDSNVIFAWRKCQREAACRITDGNAGGKPERADQRTFDGGAVIVRDGAADARMRCAGLLRNLDGALPGRLCEGLGCKSREP